jgi:very-short-patch-repair endonuclease
VFEASSDPPVEAFADKEVDAGGSILGMASIIQTLDRMGGIASVRALRARGVPIGVIRGAVKAGMVQPVRKGWIASSLASPDLLRAVVLGGRLGCVSAAGHLGLWTLAPDDKLHVAIPRHSGRATAHREPNVVPHWTSDSWAAHDSAVESIDRVIVQVATCLPTELAVATIDSALNQRFASLLHVSELLASVLPDRQDLVTLLEPLSQSGLESLCRVRLLRLGYRVRSQVAIAGVGIVDLVIGDRLVIEADGYKWHRTRQDFENDRRRDLRLAALGYRVLRLTYAQIVHEWPLVELGIRQLIAQGEHQWRSSTVAEDRARVSLAIAARHAGRSSPSVSQGQVRVPANVTSLLGVITLLSFTPSSLMVLPSPEIDGAGPLLSRL